MRRVVVPSRSTYSSRTEVSHSPQQLPQTQHKPDLPTIKSTVGEQMSIASKVGIKSQAVHMPKITQQSKLSVKPKQTGKRMVDSTSYLTVPKKKVVQSRVSAHPASRIHVQKRLGRVAKQTDLLFQVIEHGKQPNKLSIRHRLFTVRNTFSALAVVLVLLSGYVSIDTWLTNREVRAQYIAPESEDETAVSRQDQEGRDESDLPIGALSSFKTAADTPRAVYIDKLKVSARLQPMNVNKDGSMQAPRNIFDAGWYTSSAKPSKGGAVVINAHASGPTREGIFAYLDTLIEGDQIMVETGDNTKYAYEVIGKETVDKTAVDMQKLMLPQGNNIQAANFITCSGKWQSKEQTFSQRTLVYTKLIK